MNLEVNENNVRLDVYLTNNTELSRTKIQKLIKEGNILVNNKVCPSNYKVKEKDLIEIENICDENIDTLPEKMDLDIVYEDDYLLIINKKSGVVVHPAVGNYNHTLVNGLLYHFNTLSNKNTIRPGIVHRLDKDTSGVIIVAKNDKAHINLSEQIKNHEVRKIYIALVRGVVQEDEATIDMPIGRSTKDRKKMAVVKDGKNAVTHFKVLKRYPKYTLLEIKIDTGRTHQIRVHMAEIGHPVVGDMIYSNGKNDFGVEGQMLHAKSLDFKHPITGVKMHLEADLPEYFKRIIEGEEIGRN